MTAVLPRERTNRVLEARIKKLERMLQDIMEDAKITDWTVERIDRRVDDLENRIDDLDELDNLSEKADRIGEIADALNEVGGILRRV